jgi:hypothetical protein
MLYSLLVLTAGVAFAGAPDWVRDEGRGAYPASRYFTGYGEAMLGPDKDEVQCRQLAQDQAKAALSQSVSVSVTALAGSKSEERNGEASEYASSAVESASKLDIKGLKLDAYVDAKKGRCHALAAAGRADLARDYGEKAEALTGEIASIANDARAAEAEGDRSHALEYYLDARAKLQEYEDARAIAATASGKAGDAFTPPPTAGEFRSAIARLAARPVKSIDDAAWLLAFYLKNQAGLPKAEVMVLPFTFRDTRMTSPLSRYLKAALETRVGEGVKWTVVEPKHGAPAAYTLSGSYWEQGGKVKLIARLRRVSDGATSGAADVEVPAAVMAAAKLDLKPENYKAALQDQRLFGAGELEGGGLTIDSWTNKGEEGLLFSRGEKMKVFVRVNLPGYVRLIYHLADGKRVQLLDNYFLDAGKVNVAYELPHEFECDAPFGAETLQAFASTERFEPLATVHRDGYDYLEEDLAKALIKTRGMKKAKAGAQKAETRLVMTTMEK